MARVISELVAEYVDRTQHERARAVWMTAGAATAHHHRETFEFPHRRRVTSSSCDCRQLGSDRRQAMDARTTLSRALMRKPVDHPLRLGHRAGIAVEQREHPGAH